jgi:hypothetical protein
MNLRNLGLSALVLAALAPVGTARAQVTPRAGVYGGGMSLRIRNELNGRVEELTNQVMVADLLGAAGPVVVEAQYAEGRLSPRTSLTAASNFVEGRVLAGVRPIKFLTIKGGPHARAAVLPSGTRRRLFWELHAAADAPLAGEIAGAHLEFWGALVGASNVHEKLDDARGGEAALMLHLPRSPAWGKLGFRVERARFDGGVRSETVESLVLAVGLGISSHR